MKNKLYIKGLSALAAIALTTSCASDYLDLEPITDVPNSEAVATVDAAQLALYGVCAAMQCQYQGTSINQMNGEGYVNTLLNDCFGQDVISGLSKAQWGQNILNQIWDNQRLVVNNVAWMYAYTLINRANLILDGIDDAEGDSDLRDFVKAQALTFRAFAYTKLLMFYGYRWEESNNGEGYCCVLRTTAGTEPLPLATMNQVIKQVRSDLDTAIDLYSSCGLDRTYKWEPNLNIAYGVYARLGLIIHDWETAQDMAHKARQGYPIMDNNTYLSGFYRDNDELMWIPGLNEADIYYWSWGSHFAANGTYTLNWELGANAIDMTLYRQLDPNDVRRMLYITPDKKDYTRMRTRITEDYFWNPELVGNDKYNNLATGGFDQPSASSGKTAWGVYNVAAEYAYGYLHNTLSRNPDKIYFHGDLNEIDNEGFFAYYSKGTSSDCSAGVKDEFVKLTVCPFGAQLKFFSYAPYGTSAYPFMRGAEMCITEAEAAYMRGDYATALSCLKEINGKRITGYNFTAQDASLLEEIKLCRRIELWGEGNNWSDFKRWNTPLHRNKWVAKDNWEELGLTVETAGNWFDDVEEDIPADANAGWRFRIPTTESDYNPAVDISLMKY